MNTEVVKRFMKICTKHSPKCFINDSMELIVVPKNNIYFIVEDVDTELDLQIKVLSWLSRPAIKGISDYYQKRIRNIINEYFERHFYLEELEEIYRYLGNDIDREKCMRFIESDFDFNFLSEEGADNDN